MGRPCQPRPDGPSMRMHAGQEMFFVPWRAIRWETLRTAQSVTAARLRAWEVRSWMGVRECLFFDADGK